jgi:zinc transport system substrate-binding protein
MHIDKDRIMNPRKILLVLLLIIGIASSVVLINPGSSHTNNKLSVVASFYPLYDFAKEVGGDKVTVSNMTPVGAEPHDYEPSPKSLVNAQRASVFVYNGGHMEPWARKFLESYTHTAIKSSNGISLRTGRDPHFWLDPVLAKQIVNTIRDGLIKADPGNKAYYTERANDYNAQLTQLDKEYRQGLQQCRQHTVISSHQAFGYVAARYGFAVEAIAGLSPEEEPSAERLAALSRLIEDKGIKYVFFERLVSPRLAATIAHETGAQTTVFDPIEGLSDADQKQGKNYLSVQRENLHNLRSALACS